MLIIYFDLIFYYLKKVLKLQFKVGYFLFIDMEQFISEFGLS